VFSCAGHTSSMHQPGERGERMPSAALAIRWPTRCECAPDRSTQVSAGATVKRRLKTNSACCRLATTDARQGCDQDASEGLEPRTFN
jgi:hypothetical protein